MRIIRLSIVLLFLCTGSTSWSEETAAITLQQQTEKLLAQAQKEGGVLLVIYYGLRPDHFPADYPQLGAKLVSDTAGQSLMNWGKQIKEESATSTFSVGFVNFVDMDGVLAAQVQVKEFDSSGKQRKRFVIVWMKTNENKWRFLGVEDPPENWIEVE